MCTILSYHYLITLFTILSYHHVHHLNLSCYYPIILFTISSYHYFIIKFYHLIITRSSLSFNSGSRLGSYSDVRKGSIASTNRVSGTRIWSIDHTKYILILLLRCGSQLTARAQIITGNSPRRPPPRPSPRRGVRTPASGASTGWRAMGTGARWWSERGRIHTRVTCTCTQPFRIPGKQD